jgi:hypothetical protein
MELKVAQQRHGSDGLQPLASGHRTCLYLREKWKKLKRHLQVGKNGY